MPRKLPVGQPPLHWVRSLRRVCLSWRGSDELERHAAAALGLRRGARARLVRDFGAARRIDAMVVQALIHGTAPRWNPDRVEGRSRLGLNSDHSTAK